MIDDEEKLEEMRIEQALEYAILQTVYEDTFAKDWFVVEKYKEHQKNLSLNGWYFEILARCDTLTYLHSYSEIFDEHRSVAFFEALQRIHDIATGAASDFDPDCATSQLTQRIHELATGSPLDFFGSDYATSHLAVTQTTIKDVVCSVADLLNAGKDSNYSYYKPLKTILTRRTAHHQIGYKADTDIKEWPTDEACNTLNTPSTPISYEDQWAAVISLQVDLSNPDSTLKQQFSQLLLQLREEYNVPEPQKKGIEDKDMGKWSEYMLLGYLDLVIWEKFTGQQLTHFQIGSMLFPDNVDVSPDQRVRRTVKPLAQKLTQFGYLEFMRHEIRRKG